MERHTPEAEEIAVESFRGLCIVVFIWLSFMYFELYLCLVRHLCAVHARQSFCKVEG
jgi:hypothetical protein